MPFDTTTNKNCNNKETIKYRLQYQVAITILHINKHLNFKIQLKILMVLIHLQLIIYLIQKIIMIPHNKQLILKIHVLMQKMIHNCYAKHIVSCLLTNYSNIQYLLFSAIKTIESSILDDKINYSTQVCI